MALNLGAGWNPGRGDFFINLSTDNVEVAKYVCKIAGQGVIGLGALYLGYQVVRPLIETAVKNGLGGERDDQEVRDIGSGSLNVLLHCFTDERFLEVLADYESGRMKESLQKEFFKVGVTVVGLKVKIENMAQVEETKKAINKRSYMNKDLYEDVKNILIDDPECDPIINVPISTMAYRIEIDQQGYDNTRFEGPVKEDLLCSICQGVLKNPRTCQNKEHPFCLSCISQHLRNSHTCPECREHLTPETLKDPPRFLKNTLSELNIKCDYSERGCPDYVQLENLQNHVERCGFAPVMCGNEGCGMVVNKRDKEIHERDLCQFRIPRCHDCKDMKASQDEIKASQDEMKASQDEIKKCQADIKVKIDEMEIKQEKNNDEIKDSQVQMKGKLKKMKENIAGIERKQEDMKNEMKVELEGMEDKITVMERKINRTMVLTMAYRIQMDEQGYDDTRFESQIKADLLCSICQGVLKNPRTCQNKEHPFCLSCISQHLRNSHTCPECREDLTLETLKDPPRFLKNTLSELNIKCDYSEQGCPDYVLLGNLQNHVERCGFALVMCGNEGCGIVVNKRDKEIHEKELCQFRIPRCHDCKVIKANQDEKKKCQAGIKVKIDEMEMKQDDMIKKFQSDMKVQNEEIDEMKVSQDFSVVNASDDDNYN